MESGTRFAHYMILSAMGKGAMGEVWKAQDTKLGREVAIKSLPEQFAQDADRLVRFEREARTLATLNHANIAAIYGLEKSGGETALVMELVEGPTLADRLATGPMRLDEALGAARQIAEGLEAAHEQNIVHRDLKPANIKLRPDGTVKLLDFGLAKSIDGLSTSMPTLMTQPGLILGTAAYMSPEQAEGKPVDRRTDIWAFGCVLYEMLTGKRAFRGESLTDTLAAVMTSEPDWSALPAATPQQVRTLLRRCLQKNLRQRLQAIGDARVALEEIASGVGSSVTDSGLRPPGSDESLQSPFAAKRPSRIAWIAAGVAMLAVVILAASLYFVSRGHAAAQPLHLSMTLPEDWSLAISSTGLAPTSLVVSPNGQRMAILARRGQSPSTILIRDFDSPLVRPLAGTENATSLFWSADSNFIGFVSDDKLKTVAASGGDPKFVCDVTPPFGGGTWNSGGMIVFSMPNMPEKGIHKLWKVAAGGGQPTLALTNAPVPEGTNGVEASPRFLRDGRSLLYTTFRNANELIVYAGRLDSPDRVKVVATESTNVQYAEGRLLYMRGATLMAQSFDEKRLAVTGNPVAVVDKVLRQGFNPGYGLFSASENGILAYESDTAVETQLAWVDRQGHTLELIGDRKNYRAIALSHNEDRVAALIPPDLWIVNLSNNQSTQLTFSADKKGFPLWSPDDNFIDFGGPSKSASSTAYRKPSNGAGAAELIFPDGRPSLPFDRFSNGSLLYASSSPDVNGPDLWVLPGSGDRTPFRLAATPVSKRIAKFSPNGHWVAYVTNDTNGENVWVVPYLGRTDASGAKWKISGTDGGRLPQWSPDGRELFYVSSSGMLTAVEVNDDGQALGPGRSTALFTIAMSQLENGYAGWVYAVSKSGNFLVLRSSPSSSNAVSEPVNIQVNWAAGIGK
jgi:serine/threonine protein kinase/Tol biopolymer transport system component